MTSTRMTGLAALIAALAIGGTPARGQAILNPSFEADGDLFLDSTSPTGWASSVGGPFGGDVSNLYFHTHGDRGARIFAKTTGVFGAGSKATLTQTVNLTGTQNLTFDAKLQQGNSTQPWQSFLEASVYIGATKVWSSAAIGTYLDQIIDTSSFSGSFAVQFRLEALAASAATGQSSWYQFDNLRLSAIPEPSGLALGAIAAGPCAAVLARRRRRSRPRV